MTPEFVQAGNNEGICTMRLFLSAVLFVFLSASAEAQRQSPSDLWCRDQRFGPGPVDTVMICQAYTRAQCEASRTNFGACYLNPRYQRRR
jgi:hypothetical protein